MRSKRLITATGVLALALVTSAGPAVASTAQHAATGHAATTKAPAATTEAGEATSPVKALVSVLVNPLGLLTHYDVQYGTTTSYGAATPLKTLAASLGLGSYQLTLKDLVPSAVYHFRVVASSLLGTTYGQDQTFATWPVQIPFTSRGVISKNDVESKALGPRKGKSPIGWVMVVHGGGWQAVGREAMASEDSTVSYLRSIGWATDNIDYRKGEHSLPDVLATYDALRKQVGGATPICVLGHSAGGNLAMLAAEHRKSVACVISGAGPTDLVRFPNEHAYSLGGAAAAGYTPAWAFEQYMVTSFGISPKVLKRWSPADHAADMRGPVLLGASTYDPLVPQHQMAELRSAMKADHAHGTIKTVLLSGANTPSGHAPNFPHASITKKALASWERDERRLLTRVASAA